MQITTTDSKSVRSRSAQLQLDWEAAVVLTGTAIVALHVVDDTFVHPEPGTSALDHLAGGLVPVAVLVIAALAYRRVRAGLRATIAIVTGVLALVIGATSAGYEAVTVGPAGDDYTGLLVALAGLGADRCRRRDAVAVSAARRQPALTVLPQSSGRRCRRGRRTVDCLSRRPRLRRHSRDAQERPCGEPRRCLRERFVHNERRPRARGLVRPLQERRRRDRLPRPQRPAGAHPHARAARLRRSASSTVAARARARATSNLFGWGGERDIHAAIDVPARPGRTSIRTGSAASASRSAAR